MDWPSPEGQKHYLLKCLDAELGERMLPIRCANPNIRYPRQPNEIMLCTPKGRIPSTIQFTAYNDKLRNMAVEANLANATAEDPIVVTEIVGCKDNKLRRDLQKLEAPK